MAKKDTRLDLPEIDATPSPAPEKTAKKNNSKKGNKKQRKSIGKFFRDIISELKKVTWASFKKNKDNTSVQAQTGIVLIVTLFFMVVIAAVDTGLAQLLKLLINAA